MKAKEVDVKMPPSFCEMKDDELMLQGGVDEKVKDGLRYAGEGAAAASGVVRIGHLFTNDLTSRGQTVSMGIHIASIALLVAGVAAAVVGMTLPDDDES